MEFIYSKIIEFALEIIVFLILMVVFKYGFKKLKNSTHRILNPHEYFPDEELHSLMQISYLIMMGLCFVNILYKLVFIRGDLFSFAIFDIVLSLYLATRLDYSSLKNKIIIFLLIPFGSLKFLIFQTNLAGLLDLIHVPIFAYFIKVYYDRFREYTESNSLGIAILLLFMIVFISFFVTQIAEGAHPLDAIVMVSNAFTSNGYAVLGHTTVGKIDSVILVWGGYLLSGVGTATLTAGILIRHFNSRFEKLEKMIEQNNEKKE